MNSLMPVIAGAVSTAIFTASALPMLMKAFRHKMHAEVRQPNSGKCPKCHMYLVPEGTRFGMVRSIVKSPLKLFIMTAPMVAIIVAIIVAIRIMMP